MMINNYNQSVEIGDNLYWPYISDHLCGILIVGGSRSEKQLMCY